MPHNLAEERYELIITIVAKDMGSDVIDSACKGGADGATVLHGRGSGIHEKAKFFGLTIEPEKEIVLVLVKSSICDNVLDAINKGINLDRPGTGVCFTLDVGKVLGLNYKFGPDDLKKKK